MSHGHCSLESFFILERFSHHGKIRPRQNLSKRDWQVLPAVFVVTIRPAVKSLLLADLPPVSEQSAV
jgi:hypothetical protein